MNTRTCIPLAVALAFLVALTFFRRSETSPAKSFEIGLEQTAVADPKLSDTTNRDEGSSPLAIGLSDRTSDLASAFDRGSPLRLRLQPDEEARTFFTRPMELVSENFQVGLGTHGATLATDFRVYEGEEFVSDAPGGASSAKLTFAITGPSFTAIITESSGDVVTLRNRGENGGLEVLEQSAEHAKASCVADEATGVATSSLTSSLEADWEVLPEATLDPLVAFAAGIDPATGRPDKYVEPIPLGTVYAGSLKDLLVVVVLDKLATEGDSTENLSSKTSQYLAHMANVAAIYENQLGLRLLLQELILTPDSAGFQDVPSPLVDFENWMALHRPQETYAWDVASKFGELLGTVGVANLQAAGTSGGVNCNQSGLPYILVAHEIGHNLGTNHSDGGVMHPSIILGTRNFFNDVSFEETAAKDIYDYSSTRLRGVHALRHPEEMPFAHDDRIETPVGSPITFSPLDNDERSVRYGAENSKLEIEEVSRVNPLEAGSVEILPDLQLRFTPSAGYEGIAWFSYTVRGDVGNGGRGWLHKGDVSVQVGASDSDSLHLRLAPGEAFSFRPSGLGTTTIQTQPSQARVDVSIFDSRLVPDNSADSRQIMIIRVDADASGTDSFEFSRLGNRSTVNISYLDASFFQTRPDVLQFQAQDSFLQFDPMANDQLAGYRHPTTINPVKGVAAGTQGTAYFSGAARLVSATNMTPEKGALSINTAEFTVNSNSVSLPSGVLRYTPSDDSFGIARVEYTAEDATGSQQTNTVSIILPLARIRSPDESIAHVTLGHGLILDAGLLDDPDVGAPLSGVVSSNWEAVETPEGASVMFDDTEAPRTGVRFTQAGSYLLRLTATDSGYVTEREITVVVEDGPLSGGPTNDLAGWWKFDELLDFCVEDSSGAFRDGQTVGNPMPVEGQVGGALRFDGEHDFVDLSRHIEHFEALGNWTVSVWFRTNAESEQYILSASDSSSAERSISLRVDQGLLKYRVLGDEEFAQPGLQSSSTVNDNEWHLATIAVAPSGAASLYLDGVLEATAGWPFFVSVPGLDSLGIGGHRTPEGVSGHFTGLIDDVRIFRNELSQEEILTLLRVPRALAPVIALDGEPVFPQDRFDLSSLGAAVLKAPSSATTTWSHRSGPGEATFVDHTSLDTVAIFPAVGEYVIRLASDSGHVESFRELTLVRSDRNALGPFTWGIQALEAALNSSVVIPLDRSFGDPDDGASGLTYSVVENSNAALFDSVGISGTLLSIELNGQDYGASSLVLRATDPSGNSVDTTFEVTLANAPPLLSDQTFRIDENAPVGSLVGTIAVSDADGDAVSLEILGEPESALSFAPSTRRLTSQADLDFESRQRYKIRVSASDDSGSHGPTTATVTVLLNDMDEHPFFTNQELGLIEGSPNGTVIGRFNAHDPEGQPLEFSILSGSGSGTFDISDEGALVLLDGSSVSRESTPVFELQIAASDGGLTTAATVRVPLMIELVPEFAEARVLVPDALTGPLWANPGFDDSAWTVGQMGIGYDTTGNFASSIRTNIQSQMLGTSASVYLRIQFQVGNASLLSPARLEMKYDDGFVAHLNGSPLASANSPFFTTYNSTSAVDNPDEAALEFEGFTIGEQLEGALVDGANTLAIQGLNSALESPNFLVSARLLAKFTEANFLTYASWIASFPELDPGQTGPLDDPDRDGVSNLMEYFLAGSPRNHDAGEIQPRARLSLDGNEASAEMTFRQRSNTNLLPNIEYSQSLQPGSWSSKAITEPSPPVVSPDGSYSTRTLRVELSPAESASSRGFLRLRAK